MEPKLIRGSIVHMVVLYGSQSESLKLHKEENVTKIYLCYDANDHFQEIHVFFRSYEIQKETHIGT